MVENSFIDYSTNKPIVFGKCNFFQSVISGIPGVHHMTTCPHYDETGGGYKGQYSMGECLLCAYWVGPRLKPVQDQLYLDTNRGINHAGTPNPPTLEIKDRFSDIEVIQPGE